MTIVITWLSDCNKAWISALNVDVSVTLVSAPYMCVYIQMQMRVLVCTYGMQMWCMGTGYLNTSTFIPEDESPFVVPVRITYERMRMKY